MVNCYQSIQHSDMQDTLDMDHSISTLNLFALLATAIALAIVNTVKITFWFKYFYLLDRTYKQNMYLLLLENSKFLRYRK